VIQRPKQKGATALVAKSAECGLSYRITVVGHLERHWTDWFEGFSLHVQPGGLTELSGAVSDQAALFGVLLKIRDLGLPLVSVQLVE
jgi:hypothetical protein